MKIKIHFLLLIPVLLVANNANGQLQFKASSHANDNFSTFTPDKFYNDINRLKEITPQQYYNNPDFGKCFSNNINLYEQIDKRTLTSRTYVGDSGKVIIQYGYENLNYLDTKGWMRAVDTKLKPYVNGWAVLRQEQPSYLYRDGSTALSLDKGVMTFNNNVEFNSLPINNEQYTVGDNGMFVKNAARNTDKLVRFRRNSVETDYIINQPLKLSCNLIISEDIDLPAGYILSTDLGNNPDYLHKGSLAVIGPDGKAKLYLQTPVCFDKNNKRVYGSYQYHLQNGGYRLEVVIPSSWLNSSDRVYPITIDPAVTGPTTPYSGGRIPSCPFPGYGTGTIGIYVPAGITITAFYVQAGFYTPTLKINEGEINVVTSCASSGWQVDKTDTLSGFAFLNLQNFDSYYPMTCCYQPSCSVTQFNVSEELSRSAGDTSCDSTELYYDPSNNDNTPFEAYVVGNTIDVSNSNWSVLPTKICGNRCLLLMTVTANNGVPPYVITHPWLAGSDTMGSYSSSSCASTGTTTLRLTIPNCPSYSTTSQTIKVPPPTITDICGNKALGPTDSIKITINPTPHAIFGYMANGNAVSFTDSSIGASTWYWQFGDGDTSHKQNTTHTYANGGNYAVALIVSNGTCSDTTQVLINVNTGINKINSQKADLHIYPNPTSNSSTVEFTIARYSSVQLSLVNVLGQTLYSKILTPTTGNNYKTEIDLSEFANGIYEVVITTPSQSIATEVIKQ